MIFKDEPTIFREDDINRLFMFAYENKASEISLCTGEQALIAIHDTNYRVTKRLLSQGDMDIIINHLYGSNGTAQIAQGKDIDGAYSVQVDKDRFVRFRYNITSCRFLSRVGAEISIRPIDSKPRSMSDLDVEDLIKKNILQENGLVAVCGPTGSGKSTLLASFIRHILEDSELHKKILTYESPIEYVYDEVIRNSSFIRQHEIPLHLPNFSSAVRNSLRRAPDIILIGESRDYQTVQATLEASETGHQIFTTVHANSVAESVYRMINLFPTEERSIKQFEIIEALRMVIVQKLVPKIGGGRTALREILVFTQEIRDRLRHSETLRQAISTINELVDAQGISMLKSAYEMMEKGFIESRVVDQFEVMSSKSVNTNIETLF